jgi:hypothetical protein
MIKKQYRRDAPGYFYNFINSNDPERHIKDDLKPYKATIAKIKYKNKYKLNVKWHDERLYMMFILRWS